MTRYQDSEGRWVDDSPEYAASVARELANETREPSDIEGYYWSPVRIGESSGDVADVADVAVTAEQVADWGRRFEEMGMRRSRLEVTRNTVDPSEMVHGRVIHVETRSSGMLRRAMSLLLGDRLVSVSNTADSGSWLVSVTFRERAGDPPGDVLLFGRGEPYREAICDLARRVCEFLGRDYPESEVEAAMDEEVEATVTEDYPTAMPRTYGLNMENIRVHQEQTELEGFHVGQVVRHKATGEQAVVVGLDNQFLRVSTGFSNGTYLIAPSAVMMGEVWRERRRRTATETANS